jgi:UDP-3-O-[3-hydroxymyristoyl] glucosamine N-acyltransferase
VPAKARWAGFPAQPVREWWRSMAMLRRMARGAGKDGREDQE